MTLYQAMVKRFVIPVIQSHEVRGREDGRAEGKVEGRVEGLMEGRAEGKVQGRVEGLAEGLVEGQAAERTRWVEWDRRRVEADAKGLAFDEPPPGAE